jgi:hypothetical protein
MVTDGYFSDAAGVVTYAVYGFTDGAPVPDGLTFVPFADPASIIVGEPAPARAVPSVAKLTAALLAKGVITEADLDGPL